MTWGVLWAPLWGVVVFPCGKRLQEGVSGGGVSNSPGSALASL